MRPASAALSACQARLLPGEAGILMSKLPPAAWITARVGASSSSTGGIGRFALS